MLPYVEQHAIAIGPLRVYPFGLLVVAGIATGMAMLCARSAKRGFNPDTTLRFCATLIFCGLAGSHLLRLLIFEPALLFHNPRALLSFQQGGIYSFGGLLTGLAGGYLYLRWAGESAGRIWQHFDNLAFAFPFAWAFGRAGCAIAHDHLGSRSTSLLAVRFPDGPRYDLGLIELFFMLLVIALFLWLDRQVRPTGFFLGTFLSIYGLFRIWLDSLHEPGVPHFLLTPDQWFGIAAFLAGAAVLFHVERHRVRR